MEYKENDVFCEAGVESANYVAFVSMAGDVDYSAGITFDKESKTLSAGSTKLSSMKCNDGDRGYDARITFDQEHGTLSANNFKLFSMECNASDEFCEDEGSNYVALVSTTGDIDFDNGVVFDKKSGTLSADKFKLSAMECVDSDIFCEAGGETSSYMALVSLARNVEYDSSVTFDKDSRTLSTDNFKITPIECED